ncbi:unnamed protein product [Trichogramma brassicae]|uniref:Uncharacterized protein n=1 Tax=Trichogramma brassicae TaxID=86971 RepID=A0A6H5I4E2_9HYME|nr:unnamed protein product [Trichogramma brassicae]
MKAPGTSSFSTAARAIRGKEPAVSATTSIPNTYPIFLAALWSDVFVPKNHFKADLEGTSAEHEHSLYHLVSLSRGQTNNVTVHCNDPGEVLTWDFDVMRNQVLFAVLHKEKSKDFLLPTSLEAKNGRRAWTELSESSLASFATIARVFRYEFIFRNLFSRARI